MSELKKNFLMRPFSYLHPELYSYTLIYMLNQRAQKKKNLATDIIVPKNHRGERKRSCYLTILGSFLPTTCYYVSLSY